MSMLPPYDHEQVGVRRYVNLVSECIRSPEIPLEQLQTEFEIRQFVPRAVMRRTIPGLEQMMRGVVATLIDWDENSPVVLSMLKDVARRNAVPLVVLCGPNKAEHVAALVVGGDVCLTYPINPIMLQARLLAYQRLVRPTPLTLEAAGDGLPSVTFSDDSLPVLEKHDVQRVGPMILDRTARQFFASGSLVALTPKEFDLMAFLMQHAGACQGRGEILDEVWGLSYQSGTNALDVLLHGLRRKLAAYGLKEVIQTVRGVGYRLVDPGAPASCREHA